MRVFYGAVLMCLSALMAKGQTVGWMPDVTQQQTYTLHRSSSFDRSGRNDDFRTLQPGASETVLDVDGPGMVSHIWFTLNAPESYALKKIVIRMYWDGESSPSVEAPIGDFFGLGTGQYVHWESLVLSAGADKSLNSYFPMPYSKHAKITVTNQGEKKLNNLYWNIDYRVNAQPLPQGTLYFHAQYRQANPNHGWSSDWTSNGEHVVNDKVNLDGKDNYVWFEAKGHGQFVGVTMSILQNQDEWWGEGDDMFFVDEDATPTITGTGSEDYFLGAWGFEAGAENFLLHGAPMVGKEIAGSQQSVYRFHLDSPIPFQRSMKATIEHGHGNVRSDDFSSVAYWYQAEPHMAFPPLPDVSERIPRLHAVGGPGSPEAAK